MAPPQGEIINIQDEFLKRARNDNVSVVVFLTNKVQLHGHITGFDRYVLLLESAGKQQMIFKHAVTTVTPSFPMNIKLHRGGNQSGSDESGSR